MPVSVHIADVGVAVAARALVRAPRPGSIPGLCHADVAIAKPLGGSSEGAAPQLRRVALVASWDDDADIDGFAHHRLGAALAGGWHARLQPTRLFGSWPGIPDDLPRNRSVPGDGSAVVLTLGRVRLPRLRRFLRTSARAERQAVVAPGFTWGTALARPPFVATCSLWESADALAEYAYGNGGGAHPDAIATDRAEPFHHRSAFVRFHPYRLEGALEGRNGLPLGAGLLC